MIYDGIEVSDTSVSGLEYQRDAYNDEQGSNLTTVEYIGIVLSNWARHAETKRLKSVAVDVVSIYESASLEDRARLEKLYAELRNKPRATPLDGRGEGIQAVEIR